jgi:hypothetical protein
MKQSAITVTISLTIAIVLHAASGNRPSTRLGEGWTETENVVFSNCSIMVPMLYAKNPDIEVTATKDELADFASMIERLGNILMQKKTAPGLGFKTRCVDRCLLHCSLIAAIVKVGWTYKQDASEAAMQQLQELSAKYEKAKTKKDIKEIEGQIHGS